MEIMDVVFSGLKTKSAIKIVTSTKLSVVACGCVSAYAMGNLHIGEGAIDEQIKLLYLFT